MLDKIVLCLACCLVAVPMTGAEPSQDVASKLDGAVGGDTEEMLPVFVRMSDQLFCGGGEYETFASEHEKDKRSELRRFVIQTLREKQRQSWEKIAAVVGELEQEEQVRDVERFWIVNGFACDATTNACRRLAESDAVSFVYDDYPPDNPLSKPDVTGCFGGYPVWGRALQFGRRFRIVSDEGGGFALVVGPQGNSFSGPHAAGVAALMLSVNPELNAWQIKRLMEQTCKDLGDPGRDTVFGAGLLQAPDAVRAAKSVKK